MAIEVFNENGTKLNIDELDFDKGALYKENGVYIYKFFSQHQLNQRKIEENKRLLEELNPIAVQYADGEITEQEYAPTREQRLKLKQEIIGLQNN